MAVDQPETRECPLCKEDIKAHALRCKHCHADISPQPDDAVWPGSTDEGVDGFHYIGTLCHNHHLVKLYTEVKGGHILEVIAVEIGSC